MASIFSSDILTHICSHLSTVRQLATLCCVNRATSAYLLGSAGGGHWMDAARVVCGGDDFEDGERRAAMARMCPWLSVRKSIDLGYMGCKVEEVFSCCKGTCDVLVRDDVVDSRDNMIVVSVRLSVGGGGYIRDTDSKRDNYLISAAREDPRRLKAKDLRSFLLRSWSPWFYTTMVRQDSILGIFRVHDSLFAVLTADSVLFVSPTRRRILHTLSNVRVAWNRGAQCVYFGSPGEIWVVDVDGMLFYWTGVTM